MEFKHNSESMKTVVETYVIEETESLIYDNEQLDKWNKLVDELGLTGQKQIVKPEKSPIPFMHMKANIVAVFETLCPIKVKVEDYNKTPIPVEILDLIMLSKRENYFDELYIRYDDKSPDPACIGVLKLSTVYFSKVNGVAREKEENVSTARLIELKKEPDYDWCSDNDNYYLLGKWADVKQSFEELIERVKARYIKTQSASYIETIKYYNKYLDDVQVEAEKRFGDS